MLARLADFTRFPEGVYNLAGGNLWCHYASFVGLEPFDKGENKWKQFIILYLQPWLGGYNFWFDECGFGNLQAKNDLWNGKSSGQKFSPGFCLPKCRVSNNRPEFHLFFYTFLISLKISDFYLIFSWIWTWIFARLTLSKRLTLNIKILQN